MLNVFIENRLAVVGVGIIVFMVLFSFVGPLVYHTNQVQTNLLEVTKPPGSGIRWGPMRSATTCWAA